MCLSLDLEGTGASRNNEAQSELRRASLTMKFIVRVTNRVTNSTISLLVRLDISVISVDYAVRLSTSLTTGGTCLDPNKANSPANTDGEL